MVSAGPILHVTSVKRSSDRKWSIFPRRATNCGGIEGSRLVVLVCLVSLVLTDLDQKNRNTTSGEDTLQPRSGRCGWWGKACDVQHWSAQVLNL